MTDTKRRSSRALFSPILLSASLLIAGKVLAQGDYEVPRTEWGQPDLQGVWNFSSNVPMQRPARDGRGRDAREFAPPCRVGGAEGCKRCVRQDEAHQTKDER